MADGHDTADAPAPPAADDAADASPGRTRSIYEGGYRIDLTARPTVRPLLPLTAVARVAARALRAAAAPAPASLGVILSDDAELASLNEAHMGHEGPTDVLSFPLLPPSAYPRHEGAARVAGRSTAADEAQPFALPPGRRQHLGDVVVSVERAAAQAAAGRGGQTGDVAWSPADELRLLVAHGALHVSGWDHAEPTEERAMRALEREILAAD